MKRRLVVGGLVGLAWVGGSGGAAHAEPVLHVAVSQRGDFLLIGNTLGYECGGDENPPIPVVGNVGECGSSGLGDNAPDIYWRADSPEEGQAEAHNLITASEARSTAWLEVPAGATVTHAYLYWGAHISPGDPVDTTVTLDRPGPNGFEAEVHAVPPLGGWFTPDEDVTTTEYYQSFADVTAIVQEHGTGAYRVSGVHSKEFATSGTNFDHNHFAGWWMVVFYELASEPPRHLALFHGMDRVNTNSPQRATLSGFVVPNAGYDAKIGMITFEGDATIEGDYFRFNDALLENTLNPSNNFFNSTRSYFGVPVSTEGDLPQIMGIPGAMAGIDIDVLDITSLVSAGQTSAPIEAATNGDLYFLAGFVTSISTFKPEFTSSTKTAEDVDGEPLLAGDVLRYTIEVVNTGNDASVDTVLTDPLPEGVTYVPGSLTIVSGPNAGALTDAAGDDQGEYDAATRTVRVRLGTGASATEGGTIEVGESTIVTFDVTVDAEASGLISNQAIVTAAGQQGAPSEETPTDGNGPEGGVPPTDVVVDACATDAQCAAPTPYCQTETTPNACVECLTDAHCGPLAPQCDPESNACVCVPEATDVCGDGIDNDCNGVIDNGCDTDGDGIEDPDEIAAGTDPNDADSDDDGVLDGQEPNFDEDTDGDGLINALDPDSDNDGLFDGTELGLGCDHPATNTAAGHCRADADEGATKTDPLNADTDGGGVSDGNEDTNLNGAIDEGETDPNNADDDAPIQDSDGDGLSDALERTLGSDPNDADTDDDGVPDGQEPNFSDDTDGDGLINVLDVDSDNDGLFDGTELGLGCDHPATNTAAGHCRADADEGATTTSAVNPDTDGGGVSDGNEDTNLDGAIDGGESDPNDPADDAPIQDSDGDGLSDALEAEIGTDPNDADSDDDGVPDGQEPNFSDDHDGDGLINALDPDSDDDGLFDGTELGRDCSGEETSPDAGNCVPDADPTTTTNPLDPDTDNGGVPDGQEDANHNGAVDEDETDPNDPADDEEPATPGCTEDAECGGPTSGKICDEETGACVDGCRGEDGNGCPEGQVCSSEDSTPGTCAPEEEPEPEPEPSGELNPDDIVAEGNGICAARPAAAGSGPGAATLLPMVAALAGLALRRRRRTNG